MYLSSDIVESSEAGRRIGRTDFANLNRYRRRFNRCRVGSGRTCYYEGYEAALFLAFLDQPKTLYQTYPHRIWEKVLEFLEHHNYITIDKLHIVHFADDVPRFVQMYFPYTIICKPVLLDRLNETRKARIYEKERREKGTRE